MLHTGPSGGLVEAPVTHVSPGIHGQVLRVGDHGRYLTLFLGWVVVFCGSQGRVSDMTHMVLEWSSVSCGSRGQVCTHVPNMPGVVRASSVSGSAAGDCSLATYR